MNLELNVIAQLRFVEGSLAERGELANLLSAYQYLPAGGDQNFWELQSADEADAGAAVRISADCKTLDVFSMSKENVENLNYVLGRAGWTALEAFCASAESQALIEEHFVQLDVLCKVVDAGQGVAVPVPAVVQSPVAAPVQVQAEPAVQPAPAAVPVSAPAATVAATAPVEASAVDIAEVLRGANAERDEALRDLTLANARVNELTEEVSALRQLCTVASSEAAPVPANLQAFLEKHVLPLVGLGANANQTLLDDLRGIGFDVSVRLVPTQG